MKIVLYSDRVYVNDCIKYLLEKEIEIKCIVSNSLNSNDIICKDKLQNKLPSDDYSDCILISYYYGKKILFGDYLSFKWAVNFHPAPLPFYKGVKCGVHAIINEEEKFGASCHQLTDRFDEGEIIGISEFYLTKEDTGYSVMLKCQQELFLLFRDFVDNCIIKSSANLNSRILKNVKYKLQNSTYYSSKDFERLKMLDCKNVCSEKVYNVLRALYHPSYDDAYLVSKTGKRISVKLDKSDS